ncbi:Protein of unknown function [Prosthecobacter debontii]|uniref:DUF3732 domain-containing protein n=1 Tax=Prosthecobacter debontii TaxID=48467 RepID=A0A1T4X856_9BACT|nr:DUF3732 domain-containing protein [Prosthecobacter debontii]SKA85285.1 Protein of unknown function [Prosthecobacter debontii]
MLFQIKEVILWPRNSALKPRRIPFKTGAVNVITGASRTGKSAVIPIIDYCLGSHTCSIPVKTIRQACSWFGVLVETDQGEKLFARREPGSQQGTDHMFVKEGKAVDIPDTIAEKTTTADQVRRSLDELAGLTKLDFSAGDNSATNRSGRPSFRDMAAFTFQPQNVVANPDILFFKADTYDHRQKLRTIFPYVLGAITPDQLAKEHELDQQQRELKRKERELVTAREISARWLAEIRNHVSTARELGLLREEPPTLLGKPEMLALLTEIVNRTDHTLKVTAETLGDSLSELRALEKEESQISQELTSLRRRLNEMRRLTESVDQYSQALQVQRDRLKVSDWLSDQHSPEADCPVCGHDLTRATNDLEILVSSLRRVEEEAGVARGIPAAFDLEMQRVNADVKIYAEKLEAVQIRRSALTTRSTEAKKEQFRAKQVERFVGNLETSLSFYERLGEDSALAAEVDKLAKSVEILRDQVRPDQVNARKRFALDRVNGHAQKMLLRLDVEDPDAPVFLSADDLTVRIAGEDRRHLLSEIGSGSNWLGYHVATVLALHWFFMDLPHSPVPQFMVFDQPSQVYFPKKLAGAQNDTEPTILDEDVSAVRKAFKVFDHFTKKFGPRFQIIVLDHASENVWGNLAQTHLVEEWRDGAKLVPIEWLS